MYCFKSILKKKYKKKDDNKICYSVPLPAKLGYADFGVFDTSEYRFARKVAKLNLNIVSLCLATGVEPARIRPCQTLHNVSLLGTQCCEPCLRCK